MPARRILNTGISSAHRARRRFARAVAVSGGRLPITELEIPSSKRQCALTTKERLWPDDES